MALSLLIKYEGSNDTLIWKYPKEDFNSLTQIVVGESQEAFFIKDGRIFDRLGPGRYRLNSENIPLLTEALNRITGISIIHCQVFYANKTLKSDLKWGTDSKIRFIEPSFNAPIEIGASGVLSLVLEDPEVLLVNIIGGKDGIAWENNSDDFAKSLQTILRSYITTGIKANLPSIIKENNIDIFELDEHLDLLSKHLENKLRYEFMDYGVSIDRLLITKIVLPEDDESYKTIKELHKTTLHRKNEEARRSIELERENTKTELLKKENERTILSAETTAQASKVVGLAEAEVMKAQGYTKKDVLNTEAQKALAEGIGKMGSNSSEASNISQLGAGIAVAKAVGDTVSKAFDKMDEDKTDNNNEIICPNCGKHLPLSAKFCIECGASMVRICSNCKTPNSLANKYCSQCGNKLI